MLPRRLLGALRPRLGSATCRAPAPWRLPTAKHLMGARSCASDATPAAPPPRYDAAIVSLRAASFGQPAGVAEARALAAARLVIFGEIHSMPPCIELLQRTAASMMADATDAGGTLHVVREHLTFDLVRVRVGRNKPNNQVLALTLTLTLTPTRCWSTSTSSSSLC